MVPSPGETTQPDPTLSDQLGKLKHRKSESQATFLGRAAGIAAEHPDTPLTEEDLAGVSDVLNNWQFSSRRFGGIMHGLAQRSGHAVPPQEAILDDYYVPERRVVGTVSNNIMVLAKKALDGSDLACIFEIEQAGAQYTPPRTWGAAPKKAKPPRKRPPSRKPKTSRSQESDTQPGRPGPEIPTLRLNQGEEDAIRLLALPQGEIAEKLGIAYESPPTRITTAMLENGISRQELVTRAVEEGLVDMSLLPKPKTYILTDREKEVLTEYGFAGLKETAEAIGSSPQTVSEAWNRIYNKLGTSHSTRTHAFLIAKRDGIL